MRIIYYAGGSVATSDLVCKALLRYARALARAKSADLVAFPALSANNTVGVAHVLVGPASQLLSVPTEDIGIDLGDARLVEVLESRTKSLDPARPEWGADIIDVDDFTSFDWEY